MDDAGPGGLEARYAEVARDFGPALERLVAAYERDAEARRDLLQDVHVALWRSLARFDGRCSLRTWVDRVAHNTAISRAVRPNAHAPTLVVEDGLDSIAETSDPEQAFDRRRAIDRLYALVRRLRPLDRQVMLLYLEDEDAASIAEDLSRDGWKYVLPFAPGFGVIIIGRFIEGRPPAQVLVMLVIAVAALMGVLWVIARSGRRLERELAELE
jgi:RNA polymerase sigma-70 factor (ECF subfamily)